MLLKKKKKVLSLQKKTDELFTTTGVYAYIPTTLYGQLMPMKELHLWKNNPRKNDTNVPKLMKKIQAHGFRDPIIVDQNNVIRAGNTRYKAATKLGMAMIPVAKSAFKSEVSATAYGIDDNLANEDSTWDHEMLTKLMEAEDLQTNVQGFSKEALKQFELSSDFPDALPDVDISGEIGNQTYLVIQFNTESEFNSFKDLVLPKSPKHQRIVPYEKLKEFINE